MQEETKKTNGWAVASLVLGILSMIFFCFIYISLIFAVLAIIFGVIGIIKKEEKGIAKAGLILGVICVTITVILFLVLHVFDASLFTVPQWYR